jgi:hypothetical protein
MVTRLSGGLTPADGSDPRTFPAIWNSTATQIEAAQSSIVSQGTAITGLESSLSSLEIDDLADVTITGVADGQVLAYSTAVSGWVNETASGGGGLSNVVYFTANGTFTKGDYPGATAFRVKVQAAGGGGGGSGTTENRAGGGGGGGAYSELLITDIVGLSSPVSITVGAGGSGGAAGANDGTAGGSSSFGATVVCAGGGGGNSGDGTFVADNGGTVTTAGDFSLQGQGGAPRVATNTAGAGQGGSSRLGYQGGQVQLLTSGNVTGLAGAGFGGGGQGARRGAQNNAGGNGAPGIVIVEVFG